MLLRPCCPAPVQGTDFMLQLADWLKEWAAGKVTSDARFKHVTFIISDAFEPGEGEHKVRLSSTTLDGWKQQQGAMVLDTSCAEAIGLPSMLLSFCKMPSTGSRDKVSDVAT